MGLLFSHTIYKACNGQASSVCLSLSIKTVGEPTDDGWLWVDRDLAKSPVVQNSLLSPLPLKDALLCVGDKLLWASF